MKLSIEDIKRTAQRLDACDKLEGIDSWAGLVKLMLSPQGREFCENNKFPALGQLRAIPTDLSAYKVFVDCMHITLDNCKTAVLAGNTQAVINITDNTYVTKVMVMHGARATINASNYAVVLVVNIDGEVETNVDDTATVLR